MADDDILLDIRDHIATITLNKPAVLNAMSEANLDTLGEIWQRLREDVDVRAVVMTGAGRGFCSGADLNQIDLSEDRGRPPSIGPHKDWLLPLLELTKPVVCAVNGVAAGAGLSLVLASDVCVASDRARFSSIFTHIAMPAIDGVAWLLPRVLGRAKALELVMSGDIIDAREAERVGLIGYVVDHDALMARAYEMAAKFAQGPPVAVQLSKSMVLSGLTLTYTDHVASQMHAGLLNRSYARHDLEEGGRAFREKRPPRFRGLSPPEP